MKNEISLKVAKETSSEAPDVAFPLGESILWKPIIGYEKYYEISNNGFVRSIKWGYPKILSRRESGVGYYITHLWTHQKWKKFFNHRLVACHFIPNPLNKKTVNHKDLDKKNNHVSNLEWATQQENNVHSLLSQGRKYKRAELPQYKGE